MIHVMPSQLSNQNPFHHGLPKKYPHGREYNKGSYVFVKVFLGVPMLFVMA